MRLHKLFSLIGLLAACGLTAPAVFAAPVEYIVTVNTTSAVAQTGYIEFQFNGNGLAPPNNTQPANAVITNFVTTGLLIPPGMNTNDSSGQLPGTVTMGNSTTFDDYIEQMIFGTSVTFDLTLSGPALDTPNGNGGGTFTLDFLNSDQSGYLFTADPINDVPVFTVDINPDGTTTPATYPSSANGGPPVVTFSEVTAVPEPASLALLAGGLLAIAIWARRRRFAKRAI